MPKLAWFPLEEFAKNSPGERWVRQYCQAPKHSLQFIPSVYIMAIVEHEGYEPIIQAVCADCMEFIAKDIGTTAKDGVKHLV